MCNPHHASVPNAKSNPTVYAFNEHLLFNYFSIIYYSMYFRICQQLFSIAIALLIRYNKNMGIKKYKYYFRKPRSEIAKDIFTALLTTGLLVIAAQSPYFARNMVTSFKKWKKYSRKKLMTHSTN